MAENYNCNSNASNSQSLEIQQQQVQHQMNLEYDYKIIYTKCQQLINEAMDSTRSLKTREKLFNLIKCINHWCTISKYQDEASKYCRINHLGQAQDQYNPQGQLENPYLTGQATVTNYAPSAAPEFYAANSSFANVTSIAGQQQQQHQAFTPVAGQHGLGNLAMAAGAFASNVPGSQQCQFPENSAVTVECQPDMSFINNRKSMPSSHRNAKNQSHHQASSHSYSGSNTGTHSTASSTGGTRIIQTSTGTTQVWQPIKKVGNDLDPPEPEIKRRTRRTLIEDTPQRIDVLMRAALHHVENAGIEPLRQKYGDAKIRAMVEDAVHGKITSFVEFGMIALVSPEGVKRTCYECREGNCDKILGYSLNAMRHCLNYHFNQLKPQICPQCEDKYYLKSELQDHMSVHNNDFQYECDQPGCDFKTNKRSKFTYHRDKHFGTKRYRCTVKGCKRSFYEERHLRYHLNVHRGITPYMCDYCGEEFSVPSALSRHKQKHDPKFICQFCNEKFDRSRSLKNHLSRKHDFPKPVSPKRRGAGGSQAEKSDRSTRSTTTAKSKTKKAAAALSTNAGKKGKKAAAGFTDSKNYCEECDAHFGKRVKFLEHMKRFHSETKKRKVFKCKHPNCDEKFPSKEMLRFHVKKHKAALLDPGSKECPECGQGFETLFEMRVHHSQHFPDRKFKCKDCGFAFRKVIGLKRHRAKFHGGSQSDVEEEGRSPSQSNHGSPMGASGAESHSDKGSESERGEDSENESERSHSDSEEEHASDNDEDRSRSGDSNNDSGEEHPDEDEESRGDGGRDEEGGNESRDVESSIDYSGSAHENSNTSEKREVENGQMADSNTGGSHISMHNDMEEEIDEDDSADNQQHLNAHGHGQLSDEALHFLQQPPPPQPQSRFGNAEIFRSSDYADSPPPEIHHEQLQQQQQLPSMQELAGHQPLHDQGLS